MDSPGQDSVRCKPLVHKLTNVTTARYLFEDGIPATLAFGDRAPSLAILEQARAAQVRSKLWRD
jgi:hypothetical protein